MIECILKDYVDVISESIPNPAQSNYDRFVGLEHYVSGDVVIKRYGSTQNLASAMKIFHKGDILVARRNVYLHRAARVDFDGLTSGDSIVLRPKNDVVAQFLPFVLNTESFWEFAETYSDGTMSKRLSPKTLMEYKFQLPDTDHQQYYTELLWQLEKTISAEESALQSAIDLRNSFYDNTQREGYFVSNNLTYHFGTIGDEYEICNTLRKPISQAERSEMQGDYPYWGPTSILDYINVYRLDGEYALIGEDGDHFLKYLDWDMTHLISGKFNVNNHAHVIKAANGNLIKWFFYYFKHRNIEEHLTKQGGGRLKLTKATLLTLPIIIPTPEIQQELCEKYDAIETAVQTLKDKIARSKKLLKDLSESCLGEQD